MRNPVRYLLCGAAFLFAVVSPMVLCAQFQQPTADELKMTSDPMAPGADAVYLDIEEVANDPIHFWSVYERIKVLTEKGKELATVELPYLKGSDTITEIQGRTIHPDGTVIPLTIKAEDLMVAKTGDQQIQKKVFTLPSVEVGSILEYKYEIHYNDDRLSSPSWEVQQNYFVHKAHFQFTPMKAFMPNGTPGTVTSMEAIDSHGHALNSLVWWNRLPPGVTVKTSVDGSYSVDVTNIPPIPDEESMPPIESMLYKVRFYYSNAHDPDTFWMSEAKLWAKDVDNFAEPSKAMKAAVDGLITTNDSDLDKAKKLYDAVQTLDNTDFSRQKTTSELTELKIKVAKRAEDTWMQKSGSSEDIAMLYLAMLRAAGLTAYADRVVDRSWANFDPGYMNFDQLDSTLVTLSTGGKQILLDPGEKMCPFQTLSWQHSDAAGVGESPQGVAFVSTPAQQYSDNVTMRVGSVDIDAQGGVTGRINIVMTGQQALRWRQEALRNDDVELKKAFDGELEQIVPEGVEAHVDHFLSLTDPYASLMAVVNLKGTLGTVTAKRLLLPGFFFETRAKVPFVNEEKRLAPVDMHYGERVVDEITYDLPNGVTVEGAPPDANIGWPGHAILVAKSVAQPGQITIDHALSSAFTFLKADEYQDLRGFYQKVAAANQEQLVLHVAPAAAPAPAGVVGVVPAGKGN